MVGASLVMRAATPQDLELLSVVLLDAADWNGSRGLSLDAVRQDPKAWRYLEGWQRQSDFGLVLMDGPTPVGAIWARFFTRADPGYGYVSDAIPELTIAVAASRRHSGYGRVLLEAFIRAARDRGLPGLSLSVEDGNTSARRLYTDLGFLPVGRVGGSDTMELSFTGKLRTPRKWIGRFGGWIILGAALGVWLINLLFNLLVVHHFGLSPNTLVLGGFGMTSALLYTLAYRLRPDDGISPIRLVLTFLVGGLVSTEFAIFVEFFVGQIPAGSPANASLVVRSLAGIIEEACKLAVVVLAARGLTVRTARTGLFMGGAVGLGFAAFEDMKYAMASVDTVALGHSQFLALVQITLGRDAIGPLEHPVMSALIASALFAATRNGRFRITPVVVGVYLLIATAHGLIDALPLLLQESLGRDAAAGLGLVVGIAIAVVLGLVWLSYTRRLRRQELAGGLAQPAKALV